MKRREDHDCVKINRYHDAGRDRLHFQIRKGAKWHRVRQATISTPPSGAGGTAILQLYGAIRFRGTKPTSALFHVTNEHGQTYTLRFRQWRVHSYSHETGVSGNFTELELAHP